MVNYHVFFTVTPRRLPLPHFVCISFSVEKLGNGGMSLLLRGIWPTFDRHLSIKIAWHVQKTRDHAELPNYDVRHVAAVKLQLKQRWLRLGEGNCVFFLKNKSKKNPKPATSRSRVHRLIIFWTVLTAAELLSPVVFCSQAEQVPKQDLLTLTQGSTSFCWLI